MATITFTLVSLAAAVCLAEGGSSFSFPKFGLTTVKELDVKKYIGRWYQTHENYFDKVTYGNVACNIADYKLFNSTTIGVRNSGRKVPDGDLDMIRGRALVTSDPGKFVLQLDGVPDGTYWVIKLGPVNEDGLYDYSIVSSKYGLSLYVLLRDVDRLEKYEKEILDFLSKERFDDLITRPIDMYQGSRCVYLPEE